PFRGDLQERFGELDHRLIRAAVEDVIGRQLLHLTDSRLYQPLLVEAERGAPEARHPLQISLAAVVIDIDALAPRDHGRTRRLVLLEIGVRMDDARDIAACERIGLSNHGVLRSSDGREIRSWAITGQRTNANRVMSGRCAPSRDRTRRT